MDTKRHAERFERLVRIGYKSEGESSWRRGNVINISSGGFFFISYDNQAPEGVFEIEVYDLEDKPIQITGQVAWTKTWQEGPSLPGFGVKLKGSLPDKLLRIAS